MATDPQRQFSDIPAGRGEDAARFWNQELLQAAEHEREWRDMAAKLVKMMRCEDDRNEAARRSNMLWATNEVLKPAIYSQTPTPDVRRRYFEEGEPGKPDPGRDVADVMELALTSQVDLSDFDEAMEAARDDLLNVGRAVTWVVYRADVQRKALVKLEDDLGQQIFVTDDEAEMIDPEAVEVDKAGKPFTMLKAGEELKAEFVIWPDYRESPARRWSDVWWVARKHKFSKRDIKREFGKGAADKLFASAEAMATTHDAESERPATKEPKSVLARRVVWEIWCKPTGQRIWLEENGDELLKHRNALEGDKAPIDLQGFFPCPPPCYSVTTTDSRIPIPEYRMWEDDARDLDLYMTRAAAVVEVIKAVIFCDGQMMDKMPDLRDASDGTVLALPRHNTAQDLARSLYEWPVEKLANVLVVLQEAINLKKQAIFEKTGVSDLARGMTDPDETASAQRLKGAFGQFRMAPRSKPFQRFVRDTLRIMAEIMAEHFDLETLQKMSGKQISPDAFELLRDDKARSLRIDIETDSTVRPDVEQMQQQAIEFMNAQTNFLGAAAEIGAAVPELIPFLGETAKAALRPFKFGRGAEDALETAIEQLKEKSQNPQPPQPSPDKMVDAQLEQMKMQMDAMKVQLQEQTKRLNIAADILESETQRDDELLNAEADRQMQREQGDQDREVQREAAKQKAQQQRSNGNAR